MEVKSPGWGSPGGQLHPQGLQRRPGLALGGTALAAELHNTNDPGGALLHLPGGLRGFCRQVEDSLQGSSFREGGSCRGWGVIVEGEGRIQEREANWVPYLARSPLPTHSCSLILPLPRPDVKRQGDSWQGTYCTTTQDCTEAHPSTPRLGTLQLTSQILIYSGNSCSSQLSP